MILSNKEWNLDADTETGMFRRRYWTTGRKRKDGSIPTDWWPGTLGPKGYYKIQIKKRAVTAARVMWELANGPIPKDMFVDHINCNPADNRLANLRLATLTESNRNRRSFGKYKKGVWRAASGGSYWTRIYDGTKQVCFGPFDTEDEAHAMYCTQAKLRHGDYANVTNPIPLEREASSTHNRDRE